MLQRSEIIQSNDGGDGNRYREIDEIFTKNSLNEYSDYEIENLVSLFIQEDNLDKLYVTQMEQRVAQNRYSKEENEDRLRLSITVLEHFLADPSNDENDQVGVLATYDGLSRNEYLEMFNSAREELVVSYYIVALGIASSYYNKVREFFPLDFIDLVQVGNQGILQAIDTFDPAGGAIFFSYAKKCCHNEILRFLDENPNSPLKVTSDSVFILRMVRRLYTQISGDSDVPLSFTDPDFLQYAFKVVNERLAERKVVETKKPISVSFETFLAVIRSSQFPVSLDEMFQDEDGESDWQDLLSAQDLRDDGDIHLNTESGNTLSENDVSFEILEDTIKNFFKRSPKLYRAVCLWHRFGTPYEELAEAQKTDENRIKLQKSILQEYKKAISMLKREPTLEAYYALLISE